MDDGSRIDQDLNFMFRRKSTPRSARRSFIFEQLLKRRQELPKTILRPKRKMMIPLRLSRFWDKIQKILFLGFGLGILTALVYFGFFSESLRVQKIIYIKSDAEMKSAPFQSMLEPFINRHFLLVNVTDAEKQILEKYSREIQSVSVKRRIPGKLVARYQMHPEVLNLVIRNPKMEQKFVINTEGLVITENAENPSLPYLSGPFNDPVKRGVLIFDPEIIHAIVRAYALFSDKFGMKVNEIIYKKSEREIHLKTERNFFIWIDLTQNIERQLFKLKRSLSKLDIYKEPLEYIDLRISGQTGDKVIFKRKI